MQMRDRNKTGCGEGPSLYCAPLHRALRGYYFCANTVFWSTRLFFFFLVSDFGSLFNLVTLIGYSRSISAVHTGILFAFQNVNIPGLPTRAVRPPSWCLSQSAGASLALPLSGLAFLAETASGSLTTVA